MSRRKTVPHGSAATAPPPPVVASLECAALTRTEAVTWLLPGAIPMGAVTLLEGRKGTGKSSVLCQIAAAVTGERVLPGCRRLDPRAVIWLAGEEHWQSVALPRLLAAGARRDLIYRPAVLDSHGRPRAMHLPADVLLLEAAIRESGARLVVIDPYVSAVSAGIDVRVEQSARQFIEPVAHVAGVTGACFLLSRHLRKGTTGDARDQGLGSVAIGNTARAVLRCDEHPTDLGVCVLSVVSCNLSQRGPSQAYQIEGSPDGFPVIRWRGEIELSADEIAEGRGSEAERDEWSDADRLLAEVIGSGWISVGEILREADGAGLSPRAVRRSKARLKIPSRRTMFGDAGHWEWGPPPEGWPAGISATDPVGGGTPKSEGALGALEATSPVEGRKPRKRPNAPKEPSLLGVPPPDAAEGVKRAK